MKKFIIFIGIAFSLLSCVNNNNKHKLTQIEDLLKADNINTASAIMDSMDINHMSNEKEYNYYNLLKIQILSREYKSIPENIMDSCVRYYEKVNDKKRLAEAYYYKGGVLYDNGDVIDGLYFFKKAEDNIGEEDVIAKFKIYSSMAFCNFESENYNLSLHYAKKCTEAALKMKSKDRLLFSKYYEFLGYAKLGMSDSANTCLRQFIPYIKYGNEEDQRICNAEVCAHYVLQKNMHLHMNI